MQCFASAILVGEGPEVDRAQERLESTNLFEVARVTFGEQASTIKHDAYDIAFVGVPEPELFDVVLSILDESPNVPIVVLPHRGAELLGQFRGGSPYIRVEEPVLEPLGKPAPGQLPT